MTLYSLVLFAHVTAVLALFAALSGEVLSLFNLRRSASLMEARRWIELIPGFPVIVVGSVRVILLSGAYLAAKMAAFSLAWTQVSLAAVILMGALGAVTGMRMGAIRRACASATTIDTEQMGPLQDPFLKFSLESESPSF